MNIKNTNSMKRHPFIYYIGLFFVLFVACTANSEPEENAPAATEVTMPEADDDNIVITPTQFEASNMKLAKMEEQHFHEVVKANGTLNVFPQHQAAVSTYFGGTVQELQPIVGQYVKKGDLLFSIENPDFIKTQQDYLETKGQLEYLRSDYERQKNLVQDKVTSQKKYMKAQSDYEVTQVKLGALAKKLQLMGINANRLTLDNIHSSIQVFSPITGYVTEVYVTPGMFLTPSETAVSIVNTHHLHLELDLFEKNLPQVKKGQNIRFRIQDNSENTYRAKVQLINKSVNLEKRTIRVYGRLSDTPSHRPFTPGMYVEAEIEVDALSQIALPREAVVELDGTYFVLVLLEKKDQNYVFEQKEVEIGATNEEYITIKNQEDFTPETSFLTKGAFHLIVE